MIATSGNRDSIERHVQNIEGVGLCELNKFSEKCKSLMRISYDHRRFSRATFSYELN